MVRKIDTLNEKYQGRLPQQILVGIGINAGDVVAGNLGSEDKMAYSITGDTVNTGKRIESLTKASPNAIFISDAVYRQTKELIEVKEFGPVSVKGKRDPVVVYQLLGEK